MSKSLSDLFQAHKGRVALVVVALFVFACGWWGGAKRHDVANDNAALPKLHGYEFTGIAVYTAKDPKGQPVSIHYEKQPKGYVIYVKQGDTASDTNPDAFARR